MRLPLLTLILFTASPALAEAGANFKCQSARYADQIGGWIRLENGGRSGQVNLEYWNGYPPITLIEADLERAESTEEGVRYLSEADHHNGTTATLNLPSGAQEMEKFSGKIEMQYRSPETGKLRSMRYELICVRH